MLVVVTGGCGKAGRYVVGELAGRDGYRVRVLDRAAAPLPAGVELTVADMLEKGRVEAALEGADAVVHLAGIPRPGLVPDEVLFHTNTVGTFHIFDAACRLGVRRVVLISSTATLGWDWGCQDRLPRYLPLDEDHPTEPEDAYGLSKVVCERIARAFHQRCGLETMVLRPPWIATPEELAELRRRGGRDVDGLRTYAYVDARDLAVACRLAVERADLGYQVLFVAADDSTLREPLSAVLPRLWPQLAELARPLQGDRPAIANTRIKQALGWQARYGWRDGA